MTPLELYRLLPRTNCRSCGELTCLAFSVKLLQGEQRLDKCAPLFSEEDFESNRAIVQNLIGKY